MIDHLVLYAVAVSSEYRLLRHQLASSHRPQEPRGVPDMVVCVAGQRQRSWQKLSWQRATRSCVTGGGGKAAACRVMPEIRCVGESVGWRERSFGDLTPIVGRCRLCGRYSAGRRNRVSDTMPICFGGHQRRCRFRKLRWCAAAPDAEKSRNMLAHGICKAILVAPFAFGNRCDVVGLRNHFSAPKSARPRQASIPGVAY